MTPAGSPCAFLAVCFVRAIGGVRVESQLEVHAVTWSRVNFNHNLNATLSSDSSARSVLRARLVLKLQQTLSSGGLPLLPVH